MKVKHLLVALIVPLACACSNDSLDEVMNGTKQPEPIVRLERGMLQFDTESEMEEFVNALSEINEIEKRNSLIKSRFGAFTSLYDTYIEAMADAAYLDESREAYLSFKEKYEKALFFSSYKDDYGIYLPVSDVTVAMLLDANGNVRIGDETRNMKDIQNYSQLQELGLTMYNDEANRNYVESRAVGIQTVTKSGEGIGVEYDSGWHKENGKKIKLKCGRQVSSINNRTSEIVLRLHIEVSFRKKTWLGWTNYSSRSTTTGTFSGGYVGTVNFSRDESSSHDWWGDISAENLGRIDPNSKILYRSGPITANLTVDYRGIGPLQKYNFVLGEVQYAYR